MSLIPRNLKYTEEHEWVRVENSRAIIGITDHAQDELTDIVYVELPQKGKLVKKGEEIGVVESLKAVSEVFSPVSGTIVEVNQTLEDSPELINEDPYEKGWIAIIEMSHREELETLLGPEEYRKHIRE